MAEQQQTAVNGEKAKSRRPVKAKKSARRVNAVKKADGARATQVQVSADQLPRRSLEQALRVAKAMRETLAGGPATWEDIASSMEIKPIPQNKYFLWSAQAYNLVIRDENNKYTLSEIGRKILAPINPTEGVEATVQAVMTPVILSRFFTDYNGSPFPADEHIGNILERRYGVPRERLQEAKTLIKENGQFAGLFEQQTGGSLMVRLDPQSTGIPRRTPSPDATQREDDRASTQHSEGPVVSMEKTCFVITPIGEDDSEQRKHANMILKSVIEPVVNELGLTARRADQIERSGLITQQIFEYLAKARVCIADSSFNNANAFYELGIRHMCKLPTVQIIRKGDKIPFDVSQGRTIKIDMTDVYTVMDSVESARKELVQHVKHCLSPDYKGEDNPVNTYLPGVDVKVPK